MKYVSIDIETTGLDDNTCDILEFGAVLDDLSNPMPLDQLPIFHCYFVLPTYKGEPFALSMHPVIFKRIAERTEGYTYISPSKLGNMFKLFLLKYGYEKDHDRVTINVSGKNFGTFDYGFLMNQTDIDKHVQIRQKILDPAILYVQKGDISLPGLAECKKRAGLSELVSHDAVSDAMDVVKLIRFKMLQEFSGG